MRRTKYYQGYGHVTTYGDGLFTDIIKPILTSKAAVDALSEGAKSFSKSAGDKLGRYLVDKTLSKSQKSTTNKHHSKQIRPRVKESKSEEELLKEIYGNGLFKGNGLKRI